MQRARWKRAAKWGGAVVLVILIALWLGSAWLAVGWMSPNKYAFGIQEGQLVVAKFARGSAPGVKDLLFWGPPGWSMELKWTGISGWFHFRRSDPDWAVYVPLWMTACVVLIPTIAAWRLDTRARRGARAG